jgi:gamma-glutamyl-gamma-aminobutyrate hydrolase PuuD
MSNPATQDPERDSTTLPLIHATVAVAVPVSGAYRGFFPAFDGSCRKKVFNATPMRQKTPDH